MPPSCHIFLLLVIGLVLPVCSVNDQRIQLDNHDQLHASLTKAIQELQERFSLLEKNLNLNFSASMTAPIQMPKSANANTAAKGTLAGKQYFYFLTLMHCKE